MCGLIGMICKNKYGFGQKDADLFKQMLFADTLRGSDATGAFAVNKYGNMRGIKQATPAPWFVSSKKFKEFSDKVPHDVFLIGHNRKATHGEKDADQNAHPFVADPIVLVHNGMIHNHKELKQGADVDSENVAKSIATRGYLETLRDIDGAYAFIWYNVEEKKLHLIRNAQRPLFLLEGFNKFLVASEAELAYWVAARNDVKVNEVKNLVPGTLYTIDMNSLDKVQEEKLDLTKKVVVPVTTNTILISGGEKKATHTQHGAGTNGSNNKAAWLPVNESAESLFYTDDDIDSYGAFNLYRTGDKVLFKLTSVESLQECTDIAGKVANLDKQIVHVKWTDRSPKKAIKEYLSHEHYMGIIQTVINKCSLGGPMLIVRSAFPVFTRTTKSGIVVSHHMWQSEYVSGQCQNCSTHPRWTEFEKCHAWIDDKNEMQLLCPTCTELNMEEYMNV